MNEYNQLRINESIQRINTTTTQRTINEWINTTTQWMNNNQQSINHHYYHTTYQPLLPYLYHTTYHTYHTHTHTSLDTQHLPAIHTRTRTHAYTCAHTHTHARDTYMHMHTTARPQVRATDTSSHHAHHKINWHTINNHMIHTLLHTRARMRTHARDTTQSSRCQVDHICGRPTLHMRTLARAGSLVLYILTSTQLATPQKQDWYTITREQDHMTSHHIWRVVNS